MKKKLILIILCMLLVSITSAQQAKVTLYAKDGRTISISESAVEQYKNVGWYEGVTVWAADGRSKVISPFRIEEEKNVGWHQGITVWALDGRTKVINPFTADAERAVGWYTEPVVMVYAADGRTKVIPKRNIDIERNVGWYVDKSEVTVTMYAPDGRTKQVFKSKVEAEKKVGWYENIEDIYTTVYSPDGVQKRVLLADVPSEKAAGFYTHPVMYVYSADGRTLVINKNALADYRKVGWYANVPVMPSSASVNNITMYVGQKMYCPAVQFAPSDTNVKDFSLYSSKTSVVSTENNILSSEGNLIGVLSANKAGKANVTLTTANGIDDVFTVTVRNMTFYNFPCNTKVPDFTTFANTKSDKKLDKELTDINQQGYKYSDIGNTIANSYCNLLTQYGWNELENQKVIENGSFTRVFVCDDSTCLLMVIWASYNELYIIYAPIK